MRILMNFIFIFLCTLMLKQPTFWKVGNEENILMHYEEAEMDFCVYVLGFFPFFYSHISLFCVAVL